MNEVLVYTCLSACYFGHIATHTRIYINKAGKRAMEKFSGSAMWCCYDKILMQNGHYQTAITATY